jgi:hypothetical protein
MLTDNELEHAARKAGANPKYSYTWLAFLGWVRWAYNLGAESYSSQLQDEKRALRSQVISLQKAMLDSLYKASPNEQKLQDENQALRDQVTILENKLLKYKLPSTDPR